MFEFKSDDRLRQQIIDRLFQLRLVAAVNSAVNLKVGYFLGAVTSNTVESIVCVLLITYLSCQLGNVNQRHHSHTN